MISRDSARWTLAVGTILLAVSYARASLGAEPEKITNGIRMKLVLVPAGEFMMGAEESRTDTLNYFRYCDPKLLDGEQPRHRVRITKPFYMGQYSVTLNEFLMFYHDAHYKLELERDGKPSPGYLPDRDGFRLSESPNFRPWAPGWKIGMDHPVVYVSWNDAVAFCNWLGKKEGKTYRLPTEAEWEYACRAGTNSRYYFGNDPEDLVNYANAADAANATLFPHGAHIVVGNEYRRTQIPFPFLKRSDGYAWTAPVGKFRANAFGLHDMHGNVYQWCSDWYDKHYYEHSPVDDPKGPATGSQRVARGGSFREVPPSLRCASRAGSDVPSGRDCSNGFRVVCER